MSRSLHFPGRNARGTRAVPGPEPPIRRRFGLTSETATANGWAYGSKLFGDAVLFLGFGGKLPEDIDDDPSAFGLGHVHVIDPVVHLELHAGGVAEYVEDGDIGYECEEEDPAGDCDGDMEFDQRMMDSLEAAEEDSTAIEGRQREQVQQGEVDIDQYYINY